MTDKLTEALARLDRTRPPNLYRPDVDSVIEAARRWWDFPTDEDVERAAKAQYEAQMPDFSWEKAHSLNATGQYLALARAALEAVKREDR